MYAYSFCRMAAFLDRPTLPIHLFAPPRRKIGSIFAFLITKINMKDLGCRETAASVSRCAVVLYGCLVGASCRCSWTSGQSQCQNQATAMMELRGGKGSSTVLIKGPWLHTTVLPSSMMCVVVADPAAVVKGLRRACRVPCCGGVLITTVRASKDTPP